MDSVTSKRSILPALTTGCRVMEIALCGEKALVVRSKEYYYNFSVASPFLQLINVELFSKSDKCLLSSQ